MAVFFIDCQCHCYVKSHNKSTLACLVWLDFFTARCASSIYFSILFFACIDGFYHKLTQWEKINTMPKHVKLWKPMSMIHKLMRYVMCCLSLAISGVPKLPNLLKIVVKSLYKTTAKTVTSFSWSFSIQTRPENYFLCTSIPQKECPLQIPTA